MAVTRSQNNAKKGQNGAAQSTATAPTTAAPARPASAPVRRPNVPGIQRAAMVRPGVERRADNRYVLDANDPQYCVCRTALPNGLICNARVRNNSASLSSHLSSRHNPGSPYCLGQTPEDWRCECKPGNTYRNFHSVLGHIRKAHDFRGSSKKLHQLSDQTIRLRKDGTVYVPGGDEDEEYGDTDIADECGEGMPALPKEHDDDDDNGGFGGGHGFGLGQAQAIQAN